MNYIKKFVIYSENSGNHIVSLCDDGTYQCDCIGWCRHFPRQNCKHIRQVLETNPTPTNKENWDNLKGKKRKVLAAVAVFNKVCQAESKSSEQ